MTPCYIFDIDGTLADITHRLHFVKGKHLNGGTDKPAYEAFHDALVHDEPIWPVIDTLRRLWAFGNTEIILITGRMENWRKETENWLHNHGVPFNELFMRPNGDHRPDWQIKREVYYNHVKYYYSVLGIFEDRTRVVNMWRDLDLPCYQVAKGDY